jgi:hypothetical protein
MTDLIDGAYAPDEASALSEVSVDEGLAGSERYETADEPAAVRRRASAQHPIDEATRLRRHAERERDYWREQAASLQAPAFEPEHGPADDLDALVEARVRAALVEQQERAAATRAAEALDAEWNARQEAVAEHRPDFYETVVEGGRRGAWACSDVMASAIKTSEHGGEVAYVLAHHPDVAREISGLHPIAQVRAIGQLEAALARGLPAAKRVTDAPEPAPQARGIAARFRVGPDTDDFEAFERQYGGRLSR